MKQSQLTDAIDIVVLNFNNDGYIQECINSIRRNTNGKYNLIVVDQGSHDGSKEWLQEEARIDHLILNKRNKGCGEGRNQGVGVGRAEWVALIDSDIEIKDPNWLDKMWNYTIDRRVGIIEGRVRIHDWENGTWRFAGIVFCLLRRKCFEEVGQFDKRFFIGEDLDWWVRQEWSWWKTAYCYDTDVLHTCGATAHGILSKRYDELEIQRDAMLAYKYTQAFLDKTVRQNARRRRVKEIELLIRRGEDGNDSNVTTDISGFNRTERDGGGVSSSAKRDD